MSNISISIIQTFLYWEDSNKNIENLERLIDSINQPTDIIVLPEMFTTGFSDSAIDFYETINGPTIKWMSKKSSKINSVITGSIVIKENDQYYNRLIWMEPSGKYYTYDKRHLFLLGTESEKFTRGEKRVIIDYKGWKFCPQICYDLRFPVWSRNKLVDNNPEYDCLIYVANWPKSRSFVWRNLLISRALENQSFVVGVNRIGTDGNGLDHSGDSLIISPKGEILNEDNPNKEFVQTIVLSKADLNIFRESFPVIKDSDLFKIL